MNPDRIRLFIKPYCGWCLEVIDWLDARDITYDALDVTSNPSALREMIKLSDQDKAPVIDVDGEILADFSAEDLEEWWDRMGF
jgi:glutaredoxin